MTIETLFEIMYSQDSIKDPGSFIKVFEENCQVIENHVNEDYLEPPDQVLKLLSDYAYHLTQEESYAKALPQLERVLTLWESHPKYKKEDLFKVPIYETLVFSRASVNYWLRNFKDSEKDLKRLTQRFPDNDKYKQWMAAIKSQSLQVVSKILAGLVGVLLLLSIFFDEEKLGAFHTSIFVALILGVMGMILLEVIKYRRNRRIIKPSE